MSSPADANARSDPRRTPSRRAARDARIARRLIGVAVAVVIAAGGLLGWQTWGRSAYLAWQRDRQLAAAEQALESRDYASSARLAREVGRGDPQNLKAARIAARSLQLLGQPDAVRWWRRCAELDGFTVESVTEWARNAFQFDDQRSAYAALRQFPRDSDSADFHDFSGRIAASRGDWARARKHFSRALELNPAEPGLQLRFAEAHLDGADPAARSRAVGLLESLAAGPDGARSLTSLIREALSRGDAGRAKALSVRLLQLPGLSFDDRLVHLSVLRASGGGEYVAERDRLRDEAIGDPARLTRWLEWSADDGRADEAWQWFRSLAPDRQNFAPVMAAAADLLVARKDWEELRDWIFNANWAELEPRRKAFEALALARSRSGSASAALGAWSSALRESEGQPMSLHWLAGRARRWDLPREEEATLWLMVQKDVDADGALEQLAELFRRLGQAEGLLKVAQRQLELHPRDPAFEADLLYYGALLKIEPLKLRPVAERIANHVESSPAAAVALAMFKARTREAAGGLALIRGLPVEEREVPARRALFALLLALDGDRAAARAELKQPVETGLLREESQMLAEARSLARVDRVR